MHIGIDSYERSIKISGRCIENPWPCYKYTITHGQHGNKLPRWLLLSGIEDLRLIFSQKSRNAS